LSPGFETTSTVDRTLLLTLVFILGVITIPTDLSFYNPYYAFAVVTLVVLIAVQDAKLAINQLR
jgi:hypothetical protein